MGDQTETIAELKARALRFRDARSWRGFHNPKDLVLALAAEAGELCELVLWKDPAQLEAELREEPARSRFADAREARPSKAVALVLTSPLYPSTYDYLPMQHLRNVWLGERPDATLEIGARRLWRGGLRRAREIWRRDTDQWTANVAHTLAAGGHLVVVIGDGLLPSGIVDAAQPTLDAAKRAGLELEAGASVERPEHAGLTNRREHAFAFRKPG